MEELRQETRLVERGLNMSKPLGDDFADTIQSKKKRWLCDFRTNSIFGKFKITCSSCKVFGENQEFTWVFNPIEKDIKYQTTDFWPWFLKLIKIQSINFMHIFYLLKLKNLKNNDITFDLKNSNLPSQNFSRNRNDLAKVHAELEKTWNRYISRCSPGTHAFVPCNSCCLFVCYGFFYLSFINIFKLDRRTELISFIKRKELKSWFSTYIF